MNDRRKTLAARVIAQKAANAVGITEKDVNQPPSVCTYSAHYLIEAQPAADEDGKGGAEDEYAVYRVTDLLSSVTDGNVSEPVPVHVFEFAADAARFALIADALVEKYDEEAKEMRVLEQLRTMGGKGDRTEKAEREALESVEAGDVTGTPGVQ